MTEQQVLTIVIYLFIVLVAVGFGQSKHYIVTAIMSVLVLITTPEVLALLGISYWISIPFFVVYFIFGCFTVLVHFESNIKASKMTKSNIDKKRELECTHTSGWNKSFNHETHEKFNREWYAIYMKDIYPKTVYIMGWPIISVFKVGNRIESYFKNLMYKHISQKGE